MQIEESIEFELNGFGAPGRTCTSTTGYFYDMTKQNKNFRRTIVEWIILLFTAKMLQEAMYFTFPLPGPNHEQN